MLIHSFKPIIYDDSGILILGSMPGKESLIKSEYYGNNRNQFWKLIFEMFDTPYSGVYEDKLELLRANNIAIWDVIESCERKSSLDSDIRRAEINDFRGLLNKFKNIRYIFINGGKAYDLFTKKVDKELLDGIEVMRLESTSPARAIPYVKKYENWKKVKEAHNKLK